MAKASILPAVDRALGGAISRMVSDRRGEDPPVSYPEIAYRLRTDHDVTVSADTVRRFHLDITDEAVA